VRGRSILTIVLAITLGAVWAQVHPTRWRGAGPTPCVGPDGGILQCPPAAGAIAIRAGRLFDSKTGRMLTKQAVILSGDRITEVGPEAQVRIPAGAQVIDLGQATVLPGLIDAHEHMFNDRKRGETTEGGLLIAVQNAQADLRAVLGSPRSGADANWRRRGLDQTISYG
jgi:hypothetical protein